MNCHPVSLADLADWLDERLDEKSREKVSQHLAAGCPSCERNLAWLRRVMVAARADEMVEPPAEVVRKAKALYRTIIARQAAQQARPRLVLRPRLSSGFAMGLTLVAAFALLLSQVPTLLRSAGRLAYVEGAAQMQSAADLAWHAALEGDSMAEGDRLRAAGETVLVLFDGSTLRMQADSELALTRLRSGLFGASRHIALEQKSGSVEYEVAALRSPYSTFEVQSPTMRVLVRGTRFVITVSTPQESVVTVLQGSVQVENAVETAVLSERDVAVVPAQAPVVRLATLTPSVTLTLTREAIPAATQTSLATPSETLVPTTELSSPASLPSATSTAVPDQRPTVEEATVTAVATLPSYEAMTPTPTPEPSGTPGIVEVSGPLEQFPPHLLGVWQIGEWRVLVTPMTRITGQPAAGLDATATCLLPPGTSANRTVLLALRVRIEEREPKPSESPSPTAGLGPEPTLTATPAASPAVPPLVTLLPPAVQTAVQPWLTLIPWPPAQRTRTPGAMELPRPPRVSPSATAAPAAETATPSPTHTATPLSAEASEDQSGSGAATPSVALVGLRR